MAKCVILSFGDHVRQFVGPEQSSCFHYPFLDLTDLARSIMTGEQKFGVRAIRIEVVDTNIEMHAHAGATMVFVTSGSGIFRCADGEFKIRAGDVLYVPPGAAHLSIADSHTTMTEWVAYFGTDHDPQISIPI